MYVIWYSFNNEKQYNRIRQVLLQHTANTIVFLLLNFRFNDLG